MNDESYLGVKIDKLEKTDIFFPTYIVDKLREIQVLEVKELDNRIKIKYDSQGMLQSK